MGRSGALSPKTYWPGSGDILENVEDGILWEISKAHSKLDEESGETVRYVLLLGRHPDFDEPIVDVMHDHGDPKLADLLETIDVIHRKKSGGHVKYEWNDASETWRS
jgi:hypothetical protein